ncbi:MAG TPA: aquaporin [Chloroflexia bacterium]|nr:aquaporin [Chloroflexia bacterium]
MDTTITQSDWRKVIAEIVGTFFFFFIGIGGAIIAGATGGPGGVLYVALAHGIALALAISALGHVSGGHFNPAVTISMLVTRRISPMLAILYIIGQIVGGVLACLALISIFPSEAWQAVKLGTPSVVPSVNMAQAILLEAILTFFLVLAVFGTAVDTRGKGIAGFGIGLTVFVDILVGGPISGGVMNPARAITPAIVSGNWNGDQIIYWVGPIIGGLIAGLLYTALFLRKEDMPSAAGQEPPRSEPGLLSGGQ